VFQFLLFVVCAWMAVFQVAIPWYNNKPLFPLFRRKEQESPFESLNDLPDDHALRLLERGQAKIREGVILTEKAEAKAKREQEEEDSNMGVGLSASP
jgi:hypothetical protein